MRTRWTNVLIRAVVLLAVIGSTEAQAGPPPGTTGDALWAFLKSDYTTAAKYAPGWAERGDATNQAILGWMYVAGKGMPFLPAHGLNWLIKAAEQDNQIAYQLLGSIYDSGALFAPDEVGALSWLILATRDTPSAILPDAAVVERKRVEKKLNADEIAQAETLAEAWLHKHSPLKHR